MVALKNNTMCQQSWHPPIALYIFYPKIFLQLVAQASIWTYKVLEQKQISLTLKSIL